MARAKWRSLLALAAGAGSFALASSSLAAPDKTDLATSALDLGGSMAKLVWVAVPPSPTSADSDGGQYVRLAQRVKQQIELGRASASVLTSTFNVAGTAAAYTALTDPEPLSKGVAGLAAWGAKRTGDILSDTIIAQSQDQARAILARGLQESGLTPAELKTITPQQLRDKVADLTIGGQKIAVILANDPGSLDLLRANAADLATNVGVETLARAQATQDSVAQIQNELSASENNIRAYQSDAIKRLDTITSTLTSLQQTSTTQQTQLDALRLDVQGNSAALRSLAEISYSGWSTDQKLQAVQSGLFPDLSPSQRQELTQTLQSEQQREHLVADLKQATEDLSNLATIGKNIGLPSNVVQGIQGAQIVATGVAQFATGNYLGALASATSLIGLGGPDAGARQQAVMMAYLQQEFSQLNQKLDKVIDLQVDTLKAINALAQDESRFHKDVYAQLDRVESVVISNQQISQAILLNTWQPCQSLINGGALNGQYLIDSRTTLVAVLEGAGTPSYAGQCYGQMTQFLDAWVKPANWSGQIISAANFPDVVISNDTTLAEEMNLFQKQRVLAFTASRDFVLATLSVGSSASVLESLVRLEQPVVDVGFQHQLEIAVVSARSKFAAFTCDQVGVVKAAIKDLICFGLPTNTSALPNSGRLSVLMQAALLGPQSTGIVDTGVVLANLSNFALQASDGSFKFPSQTDLDGISTVGLTPEMRAGILQGKGRTLLSKLEWLTEAMVLQQSIAYGDLPPALAMSQLYNPSTRMLDSGIGDPKLSTLAVLAMRSNPVLARNSLMLAFRRAIADSLGGPDKAQAILYEQSFYKLALQDMSSGGGCGSDANASVALTQLFPGWKFSYRATAQQKAGDSRFKDCPVEVVGDASGTPAMGSGVAVEFQGFYITLPTPSALSAGMFEQTDTLREALSERDKVEQAKIDMNIRQLVGDVASTTQDPQRSAGALSFGLLNTAWDWSGSANH